MGFVEAITGLSARVLGRRGVIINEHTLTGEEMRLHVETLAPGFEFIHHDALLTRVKRPGKKPFCLFTFDDGKRSNATEVAPELDRLGVPGVFYLVSGFLDGNGPLWFDCRDAVRDAVGSFPTGLESEILKRLPLQVIRRRIDDAMRSRKLHLDLSSDDVQPMSWAQARVLAEGGHTLGAHTVDHPVLTSETTATAKEQISKSFERIAEHTGVRCPTFAFTNGNYTAELGRHALACGASTATTTEPLWVDDSFPAWRLPRIQLHPGQPASKIRLKIALALTGRVLEDPNGTGKVYRRIQAGPQG